MTLELTAEQAAVLDKALAYYARVEGVKRSQSKRERDVCLALRKGFWILQVADNEGKKVIGVQYG